jgi:hypothetical protein
LACLLLRTRYLALTLASLSLALGSSACATQREQRVSSAEARERPSDEACQPQGRSPSDRHVWGCGYWHWDSVRYVWVEGRWELPR